MTNKHEPLAWNRERLAWIVAGVLLVGGAIYLVVNWRTPPQMGADPDVFNTVDALYTAVRNQSEANIAKCERRLHGYRDNGKLPDASARYLDDVIATARRGDRPAAARQLYTFMLAQRREGK
ncbi:MAG: hypothetical protein WCL32_18525 [Planctomycetota bacterium]